jgi:transcriptional regulator with XRE-family HTH domain
MGQSQILLAKNIGLARTSLTNIENGEQKIPIHLLYKIAEQLQVPVTDLMLDSEEKTFDVEAIISKKIITSSSGTKNTLDETEQKQILDQVKKLRRKKND